TMDANYIRQVIGGNTGNVLQVAKNIDSRTVYQNPSYHYLAEGRQATEYGAYLIKKYCPAPAPTYGVFYQSGYNGIWDNQTGVWSLGQPIHDFGYQYLGGFGPYGAKISPIGMDCLTWLDEYLANN